ATAGARWRPGWPKSGQRRPPSLSDSGYRRPPTIEVKTARTMPVHPAAAGQPSAARQAPPPAARARTGSAASGRQADASASWGRAASRMATSLSQRVRAASETARRSSRSRYELRSSSRTSDGQTISSPSQRHSSGVDAVAGVAIASAAATIEPVHQVELSLRIDSLLLRLDGRGLLLAELGPSPLDGLLGARHGLEAPTHPERPHQEAAGEGTEEGDHDLAHRSAHQS